MRSFNSLRTSFLFKLALPWMAGASGCASSEDPEQWASLLEEHRAFVGMLTLRCNGGPEDFEYSDSTLGIFMHLTLTIDGERLTGRVRTAAEDHPSPPADLAGRLESGGGELFLADDQVLVHRETLRFEDFALTDLSRQSGGLVGSADATMKALQGDRTYTCKVHGDVRLVPDTSAAPIYLISSPEQPGAIEVWFEEPMKLADAEVTVEAAGERVSVDVTPVLEDDEGFGRSLLISARVPWPAAEVTVSVANASDLAGNVRAPYSAEQTVPPSSRATAN